MLIEGKVIKDFNYTRVMGSTILGNFVIYPDSGEYANQTIAITVFENTLVSIGGITHPAKEFDLTAIIKEPVLTVTDLTGVPQKIETDTWKAIAQYSADAEEITIKIP